MVSHLRLLPVHTAAFGSNPYDRRMELCISDLIGAIATGIGERDAVVTADGRVSWREFDRRGGAFAAALRSLGLGFEGDTSHFGTVADRIRSAQPHVGILAGNSAEYLLAMLGIFRARSAPVNVNYRYTAEEIAYVVEDADLRGVVYHGRYGPTLAGAVEIAGPLDLLVRIEDGSGEPPVPGSVDWDDLVGGQPYEWGPASGSRCSGDDRYLLYTGGTTGFPKGVVWRQEDWFLAALGGRQRSFTGAQDAVDFALKARPLVGMPATPMMHGAGHWTGFAILLQGGTVVLPRNPDHLDAAAVWEAVEAEGVVYLQVVGDAFLGPLLDELDRGSYDLTSLRILLTSGAVASPARKAALLERLPRLRIKDAVGASESGTTAMSNSRAPGEIDPADVRFKLDAGATVLVPDTACDGGWRAAQEGEEGFVAQAGNVPLGYYGDAAKTEVTFPVIGGVRYAVPGDHAVKLPGGDIRLLGRGSQCINTGGEKVYPEEVESRLKDHPSVVDALVAGVDDPKWGQAVGAVVQIRPGSVVSGSELAQQLRAHLAGYKVPKRWVIGEAPLSRNQIGKPDYRWAREALAASAG